MINDLIHNLLSKELVKVRKIRNFLQRKIEGRRRKSMLIKAEIIKRELKRSKRTKISLRAHCPKLKAKVRQITTVFMEIQVLSLYAPKDFIVIVWI